MDSNGKVMGGVSVMGFIAPNNISDTYPVIDPIFGIDGLRNLDTIEDMLEIPFERMRAGMIVGVEGGAKYYKLKDVDWVGDITDWAELYIVTVTDIPSTHQFVDKEEPVGFVNGINRTFLLTNTPINNSEHIYINGLLQEVNYDYVIDDNEITFDEPPLSGMRIRCSYRY